MAENTQPGPKILYNLELTDEELKGLAYVLELRRRRSEVGLLYEPYKSIAAKCQRLMEGK